MSETTSEQLAEIDRDMADIDRQVAELEQEAAEADYKTQELPDETQELPEYTPPEGWRLVPLNEPLKGGDEYHAGSDRYIRRVEQQPEAEPAVQNGLVRDVTHLLEESGVLDLAKAEQRIEELRSEVSYVQRLLGESRQRVTQLEELVASLRMIIKGQEKAFNAAGKANTDLQHRLDTVAAEWATQAETSRRLQIELNAAQQVPQAIADRFEEGWNQGTARAVETVLEWLEPIRLVDNEHLANEAMQHLPQIMRHLTGLAQD